MSSSTRADVDRSSGLESGQSGAPLRAKGLPGSWALSFSSSSSDVEIPVFCRNRLGVLGAELWPNLDNDRRVLTRTGDLGDRRWRWVEPTVKNSPKG